MKRAARFVLYLATLAGSFLAFGWPYVFGNEPSSAVFHVAAVATLVTWLASMVAALAGRR